MWSCLITTYVFSIPLVELEGRALFLVYNSIAYIKEFSLLLNMISSFLAAIFQIFLNIFDQYRCSCIVFTGAFSKRRPFFSGGTTACHVLLIKLFFEFFLLIFSRLEFSLVFLPTVLLIFLFHNHLGYS